MSFSDFINEITSHRRPLEMTITDQEYKLILKCHNPLGNFSIAEVFGDLEPVTVKTKRLITITNQLKDHWRLKHSFTASNNLCYLKPSTISQFDNSVSLILKQPEILDDHGLKLKLHQGVISVTSDLDYKYHGRDIPKAVETYNKCIQVLAIKSYPKTWETKVDKLSEFLVS